MNAIRKIYFIIYIFCFLFAPPIINNINLLIILGGYSLFLLIFKYPKKTISIIKSKDFIKVFLLLLLYLTIYFLSYSISSIFFNYDITQNLILNFYSIFLNFIITIICSIYVAIKAKEYKYTTKDLIKSFIIAAIIQLIICVMCLYLPSFRSWTIDKMMKENNAKFFESEWLVERRFYGFANNLLDLFGFGMGLISCLTLFYSEENKKYLIISFLLLITCALNSRTGLVIFALGVLFFIIYKIIKRKMKLHKLIAAFIIIAISLCVSYNLILKFSPNTINWVKNDITSFISKDNHVGTATAIYDKNFWTLPDDYSVIFGKGFSVSAYSKSKVENVVHSDCGYINEIWKVGFIGLIVYLSIQFSMIMKCYKTEKNSYLKWFFIFSIFAYLLFMIKGDLTGYNPGNVLLYTLFIHYIYNNEEVNKNEK